MSGRDFFRKAAQSRWFPILFLPLFALLYGINTRTLLIGDSQAHLYIAASLAGSGDSAPRSHFSIHQ